MIITRLIKLLALLAVAAIFSGATSLPSHTPYEKEWIIDGTLVTDLEVKTEFDTYSWNSNEIRYTLTNKSNAGIIYGEPFYVLKLINGRWYKLETEQRFSLVSHELPPGESRNFSFYPVKLSTGFLDGTYRIVKDLYPNTIYKTLSSKPEKLLAIAEFRVEKERWVNDGLITGDIQLKTESDTYYESAWQISCILQNNSANAIDLSGSFFLLEKGSNAADDWYRVPVDNVSFDNKPEFLQPGERKKITLKSNPQKYDFVEGAYRIAFTIFNQPQMLYSVADFKVVNEPWENYGILVDDVLLKTEYPEYPEDASEIRFTMTNNGSTEIDYGEDFYVIKKEGEIWYRCPLNKPRFIAIAGLMAPGRSSNFTLTPIFLKHGFQKGTYAIVKDFGDETRIKDDRSKEKLTVIAEFRIK